MIMLLQCAARVSFGMFMPTIQTRGVQTGQTGNRVFGYALRGTTMNPSLWKYYHRHGYWARRKLKINFTRHSKNYYHEAVGEGKRSWAYYKQCTGPRSGPRDYQPLGNYCKF